MDSDDFVVKSKRLPHWRSRGSIYFITWRLHRFQPVLNSNERELICAALNHFDGERYLLGAYVVMDDHIHVMVCPIEGFEIDGIVWSWRSFTANRLQRASLRQGEIWQIEPYDRIVRDSAEAAQKAKYILDNPFRRWTELDEYPYMGCGQLEWL